MMLPNELLIRLTVVVLFLAVFLEASLGKLTGGPVPDWFADKFRPTLLGRIPPPLLWWPIALAELAVVVLFVAAGGAAIMGHAMEDALFSLAFMTATLVYAALLFGLRISQDYVGAASAFLFGAATLALWVLIV
jgi:hypothetical protein